MGPKPPMKKSLLNKKKTTPVPPPPSTAVTRDDTMTWLRDGPLPPNWTRFSSRDVVVERIFRLNHICLKSNHGNIQLPNALHFLTKDKHISNYVQPGVFAFVNLTRLFYASLRVSSDGKTITGFIGNFSFSFTEEDIVQLYDKDKSFVDTAPALFTAEFLDSIPSIEDLHQSLFIIPNKKPHALVSHRHFLLYMIIHSNILPSKGNTTEMTQKMIALLWIIDNHNPCLAHIIFHNLKGVLGNKKPVVLPYPCMIASLLRAKGFIFPEFHETTLHIDVVDNRVWDRCLGSGAETRMDAFTRKNMKFTDGLVVGAPILPDTHPLVSSKRRRTLVGGSSPGSSSSAGPNNAAFSRFESSIATLTNLVTNMGLSVNARFDTLDEKVLAIQQESNARFDVLEDKIQNVQSSMDALSRNCLKAYHHGCVGKVENELDPEKRWHCRITKVPGNNINEEVTLHVSNSKKTFRIGMLSDEDFSEEGIEDLLQRVNDGLLQKLNTLLQTPAEQQRLIQEVPKVIAEEIEVEVTAPLDLPMDENPVEENSPRSILLPMDSVGTSIMTGTEDAGCVNADIKVISDLPMIAAKGDDTDSKSTKKVQDFSWVEPNRSYLDEIPVEKVTEGVNGDCIDFRGTEKAQDFELTVRGFVQNENSANAYSLLPRLAGNQDHKMDTAAEKEIEERHLSVQVNVESSKDAQLTVLEDNEGGQGTIKQHTPTAELIDLDNDSDETPESKIWHYMDPYGATHGPFPLLKLKEWWDEGHFTVVPDFKVWKGGHSQQEAVLLNDVLSGGFPEYRL